MQKEKSQRAIVCGAKTRSGGVCQKSPVAGRTRCRLHGGKTPIAGSTHPRFKNGRYSKAFPVHLQAKFQEALDDPDLLSSRHEIAILQVRINQLIEKLDTGESGNLLEKITEAWGEFKAANRRARDAGDNDVARDKARQDIQAATATIDRLVSSGASDKLAWEELREVVRERIQAGAVEHRRQVDLSQLLTIEQVMMLSGALLTAVESHVKDKNVLAAIGLEFTKVFNREPRGRITEVVVAESKPVEPEIIDAISVE